ncbi:hypothetical protein E6P97_02735 [Patescibacteria group bacterium]|nr:MAG: hypothetical protein E6P97_02735 [Patescibacteria group bacterium]
MVGNNSIFTNCITKLAALVGVVTLLFLVALSGVVRAQYTEVDPPEFIRSFGEDGTSDGQFSMPFGVSTDQEGNIYVLDTFEDNLQIFNQQGQFVDKWQGVCEYEDEEETILVDGAICSPRIVAIDNSVVYIANRDAGKVFKYDLSGTYLGSIGSGWGCDYDDAMTDDSFCGIGGIDFDSNGNLYITDISNHRVKHVRPDGTTLSIWGIEGCSYNDTVTADSLCEPNGVAVDSNNNVYIVDSGNYRLQKFSSSGNHIVQWGEQGSGAGQFDSGTYIAIDGLDMLYADNGSDQIHKFTSDGDFVRTFGGYGTGDGQFSGINGLYSDGTTLYVVDSSNNRVQMFGVVAASSANGANTVTLPNAEDGKLVHIETPSQTNITCSSALKESENIKPDDDYQYPLGLIDFCFETEDLTNEVRLIFVTNLKPDQVVAKKYDSVNQEYSTVQNASITQVDYQGESALLLTYTITDNGNLDLDSATGKIKDPIGLASADGLAETGSGRVGTALLIISIIIASSVHPLRLLGQTAVKH